MNYKLLDPEDELMLDEDVTPQDIAVRDGPLSDTHLNLDIVAPPNGAPLTSTPATKPVQNSAPSTSNGQGGFDQDYMKYWMDEAKKGAQSALSSSKKPTLLSTAPDWYKGGPPPGSNDWAKALVGMGAGMISGPAQAGLDNPLRPLSLKQQDAKQVAIGQGLGALLGGLVSKNKNRYDEELDAAKKQASMQHVASDGTSEGAQRANLAAKMIGLANQSRGLDSLIQNRSFAQDKERALHDPNSDEANAAKKLLISKGLATAEELEGQNLATMQKQYGLINTAEQEAGKSARQEAAAINKRGDIAASKQAESEAKAQARRNEDLQNEAKAYVGDDVEWKGGLPPDEATQRKAREIYGAKKFGLQALDRMTQIQNELEHMSRGFTGTVDEWLGRVAGTPEAAHAQELVTEATQIQNFLTIEARKISNMGVPQEWEQRLVASLNPRAGSLIGYLKGNASWQSLKKSLSDYADVGMDSNGLVAKGSKQTRAKPQYETNQTVVPPIAKVKGKEVVSGEEPISDEGGALPVAPVPAQPNFQAPPQGRTVKIRLGSDVREVPYEQALRLKQKNPKVEIEQ